MLNMHSLSNTPNSPPPPPATFNGPLETSPWHAMGPLTTGGKPMTLDFAGVVCNLYKNCFIFCYCV